jgi:hypothetical protein
MCVAILYTLALVQATSPALNQQMQQQLAPAVYDAIAFNRYEPLTTQNWFKLLVALLAVCIVLLWSRLVHYMCAFRSTGSLVTMVLEICKEIGYFLMLVLFLSVGFGIAFYLLFTTSGSEEAQPLYGDIPGTAVTMLSMMTGAFDQQLFFESTEPTTALVLLAVYVLLMMVALFNLLIAIMGSAYQRVSAGYCCHNVPAHT